MRTSRETANLWVWQKRTSAAEAVKHQAIYGTAKAVPFVQRRFFIQFSCRCPEAAVGAECTVAAKSRHARMPCPSFDSLLPQDFTRFRQVW
jgi:hypothetical protein